MNRVSIEYLLKGLFLSLTLFVALRHPDWADLGEIVACMVAGLALSLIVGAVRRVRDLGRLVRNPVGGFLFVLLDNPTLIYAGLIGGLVFGISRQPDWLTDPILIRIALVGCIAGYALGETRRITPGYYRFVGTFAVLVGLMYALGWWLNDGDFLTDPAARKMLAFQLLVFLPFFWLLTFTGYAEESELEIAALAGVLGLCIWLLGFPTNLPAAGVLIPLTLYYVYVTSVLPGLKVFRHTLRGYSFMEMGRTRFALKSFRRALELDRKNELARKGMSQLHRTINFDAIDKDPETAALLDVRFCLDRISADICGSTPPDKAQLDEARKLIDLVERQFPTLRSHVLYYRAVADCHGFDLDRAVASLAELLDPAKWPADDLNRRNILFPAWELTLRGHPRLRERVGLPQLAMPGRRMEALAAVERQLAKKPTEPLVLDFRQELYEGLRESDFDATRTYAATDFNFGYVEELGLKRLTASDWEVGVSWLRIASHGQPTKAIGLFQKMADAHLKADDLAGARKLRIEARDLGVSMGLDKLPADQKEPYYALVKTLAEEAAAAKNLDEAIRDYSIYTQSDKNTLEILRILAGLYEAKGDVLQALRVTEKALIYKKADKDLLERKDRYYYSLEPKVLEGVRDDVRLWFDKAYCIDKARGLLDGRPDAEVLHWAGHLADLALVMEPQNIYAQVAKARCLLRQGERMEGVRILEDVRDRTPKGGDEQEVWFFTQKQLGRLYLEELSRPDLAIACFREYQKSPKTGAETEYDLGRAYEASGDVPRAISFYERVMGYEGNPLVYDARSALSRIRAEASGGSTGV